MGRTDEVADERPDNLTDLAAAIAAAAHLGPIDRFRAITELTEQARTVLAAEKDRAVYEATRDLDYEQVAEKLAVSYSNVNNRISAHRARTGEPARRGRRPARSKS